MQLVIDIPESYYEGVILDRILETTLDGILEAIKNGKPLPKHGRLIDADKAVDDYANYGISHMWDATDLPYIMDECPTILEANEE